MDFYCQAIQLSNPGFTGDQNKLYGKYPDNYFTQIGKCLFPDVILDTGYRIQPAIGL